MFKIRASRLNKISKAFHADAGAVIGQRSEELEAHFISPASGILLSPASGKLECLLGYRIIYSQKIHKL